MELGSLHGRGLARGPWEPLGAVGGKQGRLLVRARGDELVRGGGASLLKARSTAADRLAGRSGDPARLLTPVAISSTKYIPTSYICICRLCRYLSTYNTYYHLLAILRQASLPVKRLSVISELLYMPSPARSLAQVAAPSLYFVHASDSFPLSPRPSSSACKRKDRCNLLTANPPLSLMQTSWISPFPAQSPRPRGPPMHLSMPRSAPSATSSSSA